MNTVLSIHVRADDHVQAYSEGRADCVYLGGAESVPVFCDDAATADRIARAFAELAAQMRARREGAGLGEAATTGASGAVQPTERQADVRDPARTGPGIDTEEECLGVGRVMLEGARGCGL